MARRYTTFDRVTDDLPRDLPNTIVANALLSDAINPSTLTIKVGSIGAFASSGRAYVESELISWNATSITADPVGVLLNVSRGLKGTTVASHVSASSIYNSWIFERIEETSDKVDARLPNYDSFPDATDTDPTPAIIEEATRDLAVWEGFVKLGIDRSDKNIHGERRKSGLETLSELAASSIYIEPRVFVDTLVFNASSGLQADEALLAKRNLDPWTCSVSGNSPVKYIPMSLDEQEGARYRTGLSMPLVPDALISGYVYFSELRQRWIFRKSIAISNNANISYLFSEGRGNWQFQRRANERGYAEVLRG